MNICDQRNCQAVWHLYRMNSIFYVSVMCVFIVIQYEANVCRIGWTMYIVHRVIEPQRWNVICIHPSPTPNSLLVYGSVAFIINGVSQYQCFRERNNNKKLQQQQQQQQPQTCALISLIACNKKREKQDKDFYSLNCFATQPMKGRDNDQSLYSI